MRQHYYLTATNQAQEDEGTMWFQGCRLDSPGCELPLLFTGYSTQRKHFTYVMGCEGNSKIATITSILQIWKVRVSTLFAEVDSMHAMVC